MRNDLYPKLDRNSGKPGQAKSVQGIGALRKPGGERHASNSLLLYIKWGLSARKGARASFILRPSYQKEYGRVGHLAGPAFQEPR